MDKKQGDNELTGSFALNALGEAERADLLRRAQDSDSVREELEGLQQTAALLGLSVDPVAPPARVKDNLLAAIRNTEQLPPLPTADTPSTDAKTGLSLDGPKGQAPREATAPAPQREGSNRWGQRFFALAAGLLLLAAGGLGAVVVNQQAHQQELEERLQTLTARQSELNSILSAADVQSRSQVIGNGATITLSYSATEGKMAVSTSGMPQLPEDKGYEMWLISADGATSAGMIGAASEEGMTMISGSMQGITHFGITVEPATGSSAPTTDPILLQEL